MKRALQTVLFLALVTSGCGGSRLSHDEIRKQLTDLGNSTLIPKSVGIRRVVSESGNRAIAETTVELAVQVQRDTATSPWYIAAVRLGDRNWVSIQDLTSALDEIRRRSTAGSLKALSDGIGAFRTQTGTMPNLSNIVALTDILHPQYMPNLIRDDAWGRQIDIETAGPDFRLRSFGPDGRSGTSDDVLFPE